MSASMGPLKLWFGSIIYHFLPLKAKSLLMPYDSSLEHKSFSFILSNIINMFLSNICLCAVRGYSKISTPSPIAILISSNVAKPGIT